MKIETDPYEPGTIVLKEVFSGLLLETSEGNRIGVCMRDDTFEINVIPKGKSGLKDESSWHRVDMQTGIIEKEVCNTPPVDDSDPVCQSSSNQVFPHGMP